MRAVAETALDRAAEILRDAEEVALACHVNPDPDALGSMLGLARFLASRGVRVTCSWGNDPFVRPRWLPALGGDDLVVAPGEFPERPHVMVALDTASADRLGMLASAAERAGETIVLDHHRTNPGFGSVLVLDPSASSTAELVFRLLERMGGELPEETARCLYAGIVTDTGRFQYEAATPETLRVASELRRHPFDHAALARALFEDVPLASLRAAAIALSRVELVPEKSLVWTYLTRADLERVGATIGDTDDLIDLIRMAREADVACALKEQGGGGFKVSLRSKGGTDVGAIAQAFGGGGHRLAAGYTASAGPEEEIRRLLAALPDHPRTAGR